LASRISPRQAETETDVRILVAIDGSDDAKAAVAWLGHLPLPADQNVKVLTAVLPPIAFIDVDRAQAVRTTLMAEARRLVTDATSELRLTGKFSSGEVVIEDDARQAIVTTAREWPADLIAMGARGLGSVARFFLGSVSLAVARDTPCPVLVCKGQPRQLLSITVALDGSDHARRALGWLTSELTLSPSTRLRFLGVAEPQHYPSSAPGILAPTLAAAVAAIEAERRAALEAELAAAAKTVAARLPAIETSVVSGAPADMIVRDIEHSHTDLVVLGARGLGGIRRLLLGSVSEAVLTHATCSVLIVRAP
jgi:nucleotide-binding universal stress UspA family protein